MGSPGNVATRSRSGDRDGVDDDDSRGRHLDEAHRIDHEQFPSIGSGLWWAAQTVTTVGYGDNVPVSFAGRLLAVAVMLLGIGFLTVITAAITSTFVARSRLEVTPSGADPAAAEHLHQIEKRLARIEAALTRSSTAS